ncbi:glycosyltransferase family 2 protein [Parvularcula sp. ZS-1/3]|uniref:Glycosyltransferase family 2 protein n=1 Tax=Parvularcula mediterranea TaxID=2732508 RepID=A0A7Y3W4F3_9PROT|nr:glycosyltransferase family 2 protein [Parvularcula mediterranea]NNU15680.1 glycosyltransferase family 2 protein [Parvularcula mediterranea]
MRSVTVIIVNYRAAAYILPTLERLETVRQADGLTLDVVIVDNASGDGSVAMLKEAVADKESWVSLIEAERNTGFAGGNNEGLRAVYAREEQPDAVFFLNPDTLLAENCAQKLTEALFAEDKVGIVGARIENEDGSERASAFVFPSLMGELTTNAPFASKLGFQSSYRRASQDGEPYQVAWVSGAAFLVKRSALEDVPFMDDRFFLYFEEIDFQRAITKAGWKTLHHPGARCMHHAGVSTGIKAGRAAAKTLPAYWYESWRHYFVSNHGRLYAAFAAVGHLMGVGAMRLVDGLRGRPQSGGIALGTFAKECFVGSLMKPAPQRNNP